MKHSIAIHRLLPHEEVSHNHVIKLVEDIRQMDIINPILVEKNHMVILDGHHRFAAAKILGLSEVPAHLVDYDSVELLFWKDGAQYTKQEVIERAQKGILFPCKTTRHIYKS